jgi:hypothetical protein
MWISGTALKTSQPVAIFVVPPSFHAGIPQGSTPMQKSRFVPLNARWRNSGGTKILNKDKALKPLFHYSTCSTFIFRVYRLAFQFVSASLRSVQVNL